MKNKFKEAGYSVLDLLTGYKGVTRNINNYRIKFPARWSRYYEQGYERDTFKFFTKTVKKGDTILDIGSHIGLFVVPFSQLTGNEGKVFCFEPTPSTFLILEKTLRLNKCTNVMPINAAVSDKTGKVIFNLTSREGGEGSNSNSLVNMERTITSVEINAYSIDDFCEENGLTAQILKIDVEGAELLALRGAAKTFRDCRPSGILALHPESIAEFGHSLEEIWTCLEEYRVQIFCKGVQMLKKEFCANDDLFDIEFIPA